MYLRISIFFLVIVSTHLGANNRESYLKDIPIAKRASGIDKIDCIYVINMKERKEKWQRTQKRLLEYGAFPNRVDAIDGWKLKVGDYKKLKGGYSRWMTRGKVGCFLSHLSVYRDAIRRNLKVIWVCEDDIQCDQDPRLLTSMIDKITKIDPDWDVLYTDRETKSIHGGLLVPQLYSIDKHNPYIPKRDPRRYLLREHVSEDFCKSGFRWGMYSMIISQKGLKKLYPLMLKMPIWGPIDEVIHFLPNIREYSCYEPIVSVDLSDLQSDTHYNPKSNRKL